MNNTVDYSLKELNQDLKSLMYGIQDRYKIEDIEEFKRVNNIEDIENFENFENFMDIFIEEKKGRKSDGTFEYNEPEDMINDQGSKVWKKSLIHDCHYDMDSDNDMSRNEMMMYVMKYQLAVLDISLFLDTHPNDPIALIKHNEFATKLEQYKNEYTRLYGPLNNMTTDMSGSWRYIDCPWPWEQNFQ